MGHIFRRSCGSIFDQHHAIQVTIETSSGLSAGRAPRRDAVVSQRAAPMFLLAGAVAKMA